MIRRALATLVTLAVVAWPAFAQVGGDVPAPEKLVHVVVAPVSIPAGTTAHVPVKLTIESSWHINANPPSPDYMIPTTVEVVSAHGLQGGAASYPGPQMLKVGFDDQPLFVYSGTITVELPITALDEAENGTHALQGKLRFQSCNDQVCLAPASIAFKIPVTVTGGKAAPAGTTKPPAETTPPPSATAPEPTASGATPPALQPSSGFATAPPKGGSSAALDNPIARKLGSGSWTAFLTLFLIGLALNLTPCVYPMLGVTVSIFGARRAAPPLQVLGLAIVYVLGMSLMYSTLGLVAAFTGGLFGGWLQSPIVLIAIGVLLAALSLSMFGVYEIQLPPQLLSKLGGTTATGVAGTFVSGLLVGIFAAPCVGPPIVALLALVGAKGDPWFGFSSFFVLSMGLGAPYLVLGTFSNLLQTLPRSGEWMVWVKKLFGVVLLALGAFYAMLALAPKLALWVGPAAAILGGIYLGFVEKSRNKRPAFGWLKRAVGTLGIAFGVYAFATAPRGGLTFEAFTREAYDAAVASGSPVLLDFTANWCVPCHELERSTFSDRGVQQEARRYKKFRVDLTRYDSPEADRWRKEFAVRGVPTVMFIRPGGDEVKEIRVEGFVKPPDFIERLRKASDASAKAR